MVGAEEYARILDEAILRAKRPKAKMPKASRGGLHDIGVMRKKLGLSRYPTRGRA